MTTANDVPSDSVGAVHSELDAAWRRYGVRPADRRTMAEDILADLRAAAADGRDPRVMLGSDVGTFARQVADARAVERRRPAYARMLLGGLAGASGTFILGISPTMALLDSLLAGTYSERDEWARAALGYGLLALACLAAALVGIALALRGLGAVRSTLWRAALLLPPTGLTVTPLTILFAAGTGYSTAMSIVTLEAGMTLGPAAAALASARRWALRSARE